LLARRALTAILADEQHAATIGFHLPQYRRIVVANDGLEFARFEFNGKVLPTYDEAALALARDWLGVVDAAAIPL
jgi:hypothetical protein